MKKYTLLLLPMGLLSLCSFFTTVAADEEKSMFDATVSKVEDEILKKAGLLSYTISDHKERRVELTFHENEPLARAELNDNNTVWVTADGDTIYFAVKDNADGMTKGIKMRKEELACFLACLKAIDHHKHSQQESK